jgi:hypothetical protein
MGIFSSVFGGTGKFDSQNSAVMGFTTNMTQVRDRAAGAYDKLIRDLSREQTINWNTYSQAHRDARKSWERQVDQNRARLSAGLEQSYSTLASGRDDTLALLRQQVDEAMSRRTVQNAFTGLSQTSFGQGALDAIAAQGALQQGAVVEQYAQSLASARAGIAGALSAYDAGVAQTSLGLGLDKAAMQSNMMDRYTTARTGIGMQSVALDTELGAQQALTRFNARWQATNNNSIGNSFGKSLVGAGIGAIGALVGGPAGAMIGSQIGAAATSDTGQGGWGGAPSSGGGGMGGLGSMLGGLGSLFGGG